MDGVTNTGTQITGLVVLVGFTERPKGAMEGKGAVVPKKIR